MAESLAVVRELTEASSVTVLGEMEAEREAFDEVDEEE